jgi:hypothetical protein
MIIAWLQIRAVFWMFQGFVVLLRHLTDPRIHEDSVLKSVKAVRKGAERCEVTPVLQEWCLVRNFLTNCGPVGFSERTQIHGVS